MVIFIVVSFRLHIHVIFWNLVKSIHRFLLPLVGMPCHLWILMLLSISPTFKPYTTLSIASRINSSMYNVKELWPESYTLVELLYIYIVPPGAENSPIIIILTFWPMCRFPMSLFISSRPFFSMNTLISSNLLYQMPCRNLQDIMCCRLLSAQTHNALVASLVPFPFRNSIGPLLYIQSSVSALDCISFTRLSARFWMHAWVG